jgi:hypothetical protein
MEVRRSVERQLLTHYTRGLVETGLGEDEAHSAAEAMLRKAIEYAQQRGLYDVGPIGSRVLAMDGPPWRPYFDEIRRTEGVTDEDIRRWWDLDEVARNMALLSVEQSQGAIFLSARRRGFSDMEAADECWRCMPYYREIDMPDNPKARDKMLPAELLQRVDAFRERLVQSADRAAVEESRRHPTYNSYVRALVSSGRL